jgi:hypothetical protein
MLNTIRSVSGEFIDHNSPSTGPCSVIGIVFFDPHLKSMPTGYTSNYFFEFCKGTFDCSCSVLRVVVETTGFKFSTKAATD